MSDLFSQEKRFKLEFVAKHVRYTSCTLTTIGHSNGHGFESARRIDVLVAVTKQSSDEAADMTWRITADPKDGEMINTVKNTTETRTSASN
jgi:hypothetical protein